MKKNVLFFMAFVLLAATRAFAYDFSAVAPSGQTLYYNIVNGAVQVTRHDSYSSLTGALTIPSSVTHNGTTYSVTGIGKDAFSGCSGLTMAIQPKWIGKMYSILLINSST